jgi:hypothetical protein
MKKTVTPRIFIVFPRINALEILRYTNLNVIEIGSLWVTAMASQCDLETFKLNGWNYSTE